jgi:hypothetical protein
MGYIGTQMKLVAAFGIWIGMATAWAGAMPPVQTVFVIVLENHDWSDFKGNTNAPFLNGTLLPMASFCEEYYNPTGLHPSLPNYLWLPQSAVNCSSMDLWPT